MLSRVLTLMGMYIGKTLNALESTSNDDAFKDIDLEFGPGQAN